VTSCEWLDRILVVSPCHYVICTNEKDYKKELSRLKISPKSRPPFLSRVAHATVHFFDQTKHNHLAAIVCVGSLKGMTRGQIAVLIAHGAVHIWQEVKDAMGEKYPGIETEAYSIQRIAQSLIESYRYQTSRKKAKA